MKSTLKKKKLTADEIAERADQGEDVTRYFSGKGKMMRGFERDDIQRVNVDFTEEILIQLDAEAKRLNISRQAVIKTMISESLIEGLRFAVRKKLLEL